jgi:hypothetical protein
MRNINTKAVLTIAALISLAGCSKKEEPPTALALVQQWVHGNYNNVAQAEADMAADLLPEQMHRPMHQLFSRVEVPNIDGYILFQQSSMDGSETPAMIFRHGLMQYFNDPDSGVLHQRELYFKEPEPFKNAHRNPEILEDVTLDAMTWDAGCDFYLEASEDGSMVSGPLLDGKCVMFNQGLQKNMVADDKVEIAATEYAFRGRFRDEDGNILWGTESEDLNRLVRQEP